MVKKVGQIDWGGGGGGWDVIRWCSRLQRLIVVAVATVVRSTMGRATRQSNQGSCRYGGGRSQRNRMLELGLVI